MTEVIDQEPDFMIPRVMICPFCGYGREIYGIGAVYCGPHKLPGGFYHPAVRMIERDNNKLT